jgi:hypothetical protein
MLTFLLCQQQKKNSIYDKTCPLSLKQFFFVLSQPDTDLFDSKPQSLQALLLLFVGHCGYFLWQRKQFNFEPILIFSFHSQRKNFWAHIQRIELS